MMGEMVLMMGERFPILMGERFSILMGERFSILMGERFPILMGERFPILMGERFSILMGERVPMMGEKVMGDAHGWRRGARNLRSGFIGTSKNAGLHEYSPPIHCL